MTLRPGFQLGLSIGAQVLLGIDFPITFQDDGTYAKGEVPVSRLTNGRTRRAKKFHNIYRLPA